MCKFEGLGSEWFEEENLPCSNMGDKERGPQKCTTNPGEGAQERVTSRVL